MTDLERLDQLDQLTKRCLIAFGLAVFAAIVGLAALVIVYVL